MMGLGTLSNNGGGSSSSYSNLSPLAPPFTVDRPNNNKPNSFNFTDSHYSVPFGHSWQYADSMPLSPEFSPSGSVNPSNTLWSTSNNNSAVKTSAEAYSFACEGYYSPYVSPVVTTDTPLVAFNEPSLPDPGSNNHANVSSQVDYTQSLSGLEYPVSHWNPVWNQMGDGKQDDRKVNASASFGYGNCMPQGNLLEGVNIAEEDPCALSGNFIDRMYSGPSSMVHMEDQSYLARAPALSGNLTDRMYTGPSSLGHTDEKSYPAQEPVYPSFNSKTASMGSISPVSCQAGLSSGSSKNYLNYENPFTPHEKFFQPLDSCLRDATSASKSSPVVVIRPAPAGSRVFTQKTDLHKTVDICKPGASNNEKSDVCDLLKSEETRLPTGSSVQGYSLDTSSLNFGKDVKDGNVCVSSSISSQYSSHPLVGSIADITVEERSGSQAPYSSAPPMSFTENCSDALELNNPNVDSPCWKGAPASRISRCDSVGAPNPLQFKSKLEYSDYGLTKALFPPAEHSGKTSSKKLGEDNMHNHRVYAGIDLSVHSGGSGTTNYITKDHRTDDLTEENFEQMDLSNSNGVLKFSEDLNKPSKGYDELQHSENDSQIKSSCGNHLNVDEHKYGPTKHSLKEGFMHSGLNLNDALEDGVVALDAAEKVLRSPASQEGAKQAHPYQMGSSLKLDVQTLVNAILNLSELLNSQCLANACLLEEQDYDTLEHAINNLGACTSKKIETKEAIFSQHDAFQKSGESRGPYMDTGTGHPQFVEEITLDSCRIGYQPMHEDKSKSNGKKAESSLLPTPFKDDDSKEEVAQAIKKVLEENFLCDEDIQPQALLFKNLWLEAEAKLCCISYKARFDRMKIEMGKHNVNQDFNSAVAPEAENDTVSKTTSQSPSTSSKSVHIDDSEDSVLERFNILNRREEKLSSLKEENDFATVAGDAEDPVKMRLNISRQQGNYCSSSFMEEKNAPDMVANENEDSVMERLDILRHSGDNLKSSFMEEKNDHDVFANGAEDSVMVRLNILRQRGDYLNSSFMEEKKDPDVLANDAENSAMARFRILKCRGDNLNSPFMEVKKDLNMAAAGSAGMERLEFLKEEVSEDPSPNVVIEPYFYYQSVNVSDGKYGSYVDDSGYNSTKQFLLSVADDPVVHSNWKTRLGNQHSSGLYDNSSSDWEHVVKDELV